MNPIFFLMTTIVSQPQEPNQKPEQFKCVVEDSLSPQEGAPVLEPVTVKEHAAEIDSKNIFKADSKNIDIVADVSISGAALEIYDNLDDQNPTTFASARTMRLSNEIRGEENAALVTYTRTDVVDLTLRCWISDEKKN